MRFPVGVRVGVDLEVEKVDTGVLQLRCDRDDRVPIDGLEHLEQIRLIRLSIVDGQ